MINQSIKFSSVSVRLLVLIFKSCLIPIYQLIRPLHPNVNVQENQTVEEILKYISLAALA